MKPNKSKSEKDRRIIRTVFFLTVVALVFSISYGMFSLADSYSLHDDFILADVLLF
jgi:hypothetical protein